MNRKLVDFRILAVLLGINIGVTLFSGLSAVNVFAFLACVAGFFLVEVTLYPSEPGVSNEY